MFGFKSKAHRDHDRSRRLYGPEDSNADKHVKLDEIDTAYHDLEDFTQHLKRSTAVPAPHEAIEHGPSPEDRADAKLSKATYDTLVKEREREIELREREALVTANEKAAKVWINTPDAHTHKACPKCLSVAVIRKFTSNWRPALEHFELPPYVPAYRTEYDFFFTRIGRPMPSTVDVRPRYDPENFRKSDPYEALEVRCASCEYIFYERPADQPGALIHQSTKSVKLRKGPAFDAVVRFLEETSDLHSPKWRAETIMNILGMNAEPVVSKNDETNNDAENTNRS